MIREAAERGWILACVLGAYGSTLLLGDVPLLSLRAAVTLAVMLAACAQYRRVGRLAARIRRRSQ